MRTSRRKFISSSLAAVAGTAAACAPASLANYPAIPSIHSVDDDEYWAIIRQQYPLTFDRTYFNTGGLGPAPYRVLDALTETITSLQRISETGHSNLDRVRPDVASFIGADQSEIAFTRNATEGNATIASGLTLQSGDEVIIESHAHPGGAMSWMVRQKEDGIRVNIFEPSANSVAENLERIAKLITPATKVIQVSHITAPTGIRLPVHEIATLANNAGAWFHIDGAQSLGAIDFSVHDIGCDSYASSGHKWLGAPHGTGVLFVRNDKQDLVRPTEAGAYSNAAYELPDVFEYNPTAQRYESGTRNAANVVGFHAAVQFQNLIGKRRVETYGRNLGRYLRAQLRTLDGVTVLSPEDGDLDTAMTTFKLANLGYRELDSFLSNEYRLRCRNVSERGLDAVRISTHLFNSKQDCDLVIAGVQEALTR